jgi:hypothetical protein
VHSSTSSSDTDRSDSATTWSSAERIPHRANLTVAAAGIALGLIAVAAFELMLRVEGAPPTVIDDPAMWAIERDSARTADNSVILVGASRIQMGFSSDVFHERFPDRPLVVLPIDGRTPWPVLRDISRDPEVVGTIIVSSLSCLLPNEGFDLSPEYAAYADILASPSAVAERRIVTQVQWHLRIANPRNSWVGLVQHGEIGRPGVVMGPDRIRHADFLSRTDKGAGLRRVPTGRTPWFERPQAEREALLARSRRLIRSWVEPLTARGCTVAFVRFPPDAAGRAHREIVEPRAATWDQVLPYVGADVVVYAEDFPQLLDVRVPDGSHIDVRDKNKFTAQLLDILHRHGLFR